MHKNDRNLKKFSPAAPIGTAGTQFLLLILKNRFKFSIYESKIQKFFACGAKIFHVQIFLPVPLPKKIPGATPANMFCIIDWIELQFRFGLKLLGKGITCPFTGSERSMPNAPILRQKSMKSMQPPKFVQSPKTTTCLQTLRLRPRPLLQHRLPLLHGKPEREMFTVWTQIWAKFFCPVGDKGVKFHG